MCGLSVRKVQWYDVMEMLTFGCTQQRLPPQSQKCLDSRNTRWDLLLYKRAYPLANTEQIVRRNVLVQNHLQDMDSYYMIQQQQQKSQNSIISVEMSNCSN